MQNNDFYIGELVRLRQEQAASAQRMSDSASTDSRDAYKRQIGDAWKQSFDLNDSASLSDSTSFADSAHDTADVEITFADRVTHMHGLHKAKLAATNATDSVEPRIAYAQRLSDGWRAA